MIPFHMHWSYHTLTLHTAINMIIPSFITDKVFVSCYSTVSIDIVKKKKKQ